MIHLLLLAAGLSGNFVHPEPAPPPEIPVTVYQQRRTRLLAELGGCTAVISSQGEVNGITEDYRQDADFYWLTGINEPNAHLVLQPKSAYRKVVLFLKPRDPEAERWTGPRDPVSPELLEKYGVDRVWRGSPESALVNSGLHHDCVAIITPAGMEKADRGDDELAMRLAGRFGLKVVYKRDLLAQGRFEIAFPHRTRWETPLSVAGGAVFFAGLLGCAFCVGSRIRFPRREFPTVERIDGRPRRAPCSTQLSMARLG
jgi:hypothetical protein